MADVVWLLICELWEHSWDHDDHVMQSFFSWFFVDFLQQILESIGIIHQHLKHNIMSSNTLVMFFFLVLVIEAGIPKMLAASAAYPRGFGMAVSELIPMRQPRLSEHAALDLSYPSGDDLGSLDDLRKGTARTWWRKI